MEIQGGQGEVTTGSNYNKELIAQVIKGKRTKRQRPTSPLISLGPNCDSSSVEFPETLLLLGYNNNNNNNHNPDREMSPSTSPELSESVSEAIGKEEEDMANCLILLAKGRWNHNDSYKKHPPSSTNATSSGSLIKTSAGLEVYQCKTCYRCFPSFQALGGHRTSHKKPKVNTLFQEEKIKQPFQENIHQTRSDNNTNTTLSLQLLPNSTPGGAHKSNKVHECSTCGAQFSSGQALGGHMRRHRQFPSPSSITLTSLSAISSPEASQELKKPRTSLELDLNVPAEPEDIIDRDSKLRFASNEQVMVFSASPLVDCHY